MDFVERPKMHTRSGEIRLRKDLDQLLDDHRWPHAVKFVPGMNIIQRWAKVIA
jgi:hypothetical protein